MDSQKQELLRQRTLYWASQIEAWNLEWTTGIYPGEMAYFLGLCEVAGVKTIVESGRGHHAYSTQVLGEYSKRVDVDLVSLDFLPLEKSLFKDKLKGFSRLKCLAGDSFAQLPNAMVSAKGPIALLLDGPKQHEANSMSVVAHLLYNVTVVAHHNSHEGSSSSNEFKALFGGAFYPEQLGLEKIPAWQKFQLWEKSNTEGNRSAGRPLDQSTLIMADLSGTDKSLKRLFAVSCALRYAPIWLYFKWSRVKATVVSA